MSVASEKIRVKSENIVSSDVEFGITEGHEGEVHCTE